MKSHSKNNSGKKEIVLFGKRSFLVYALLALVVVTAAAAVLIAPGGSENSSAAGTWIGDGSPTDPYQIGSVQDLADLAYDVNYNGNDHSGEWFILTADLDLTQYNTGSGWQSIGASSGFSGNFNGNGHTVSNLFINNNYNYDGLFGLVTNGQIENLGVLNANVTGNSLVGGLIGNATNSTVENCYVTGTVTGSGNYVGGVVGYNSGSTVGNCYKTGGVNDGVGSDVGGVVGVIVSGGVVENCYNTGGVSIGGGGSNAGGVVGSNNTGCVVKNCYNTGDVSIDGGGSVVGGVVGINTGGMVENCYNTGEVTGSGSDAGGVAGNISGGTVENCYNTGAVSLDGGGNNVGGVAGNFSGGTVGNCYNIGPVSLTGGGSYAGGVVGYSGGTVGNCYNTGAVSLTGSGSYVGGVAGFNATTVENCYNTGAVSLTGGGSDAGGVVGFNATTVENCFFKWVSGGFNGGLFGIGNTSLNTGAARASDAGLQTLSTFIGAGWDFVGTSTTPPVWFMLNNVTYPMLFWQIADSGSGSDISDPFIVTTMQQMENIQNIFVAHNVSNGKYWQLGKDINATGYFAEKGPGYNGGAGWVPIGNDNYQRFYGNFDGSGHTITGLSINSTGYDNTGLFGWCDGGMISNLGLVNVTTNGDWYVGGVAGYASDSATITNCYVTGAVKGDSYVGGIAGAVTNSLLCNCYNMSDVEGNTDIGGVAGFNGSTIENCYNTGNVTLTGGGDYVGGVVGYNSYSGTVENCYNTGNVTLTGGGDYVGGVVGYNSNSGTVENCFFLQSAVSGEINFGLNGVGNGPNTGAEPIGDALMRTQDTFTNSNLLNTSTGWDFGNTGAWGMYPNDTAGGLSYGYPYLKTIDNFILITPDGGSKLYDGNPAPVPTWTSNDTYDISLFSGSLTYDPTPATDANTYNITIGTLDSPYYQVRFQDDVQYRILTQDQIADRGSGTDTDPYIVTTMEQIENIQYYFVVNGLSNGVYWQLGNDIDASSYFAAVGGPGYNGGAGWVPIGDDSNSFSGIFDGNGHTITGLFVDHGSDDNTGLFGSVVGGEIMNLGVVDAKITGNSYVGGVAGAISGNSSIENCFVAGNSTVTGGSMVGGVVGINDGSIVENCYNTSAVNGSGYYIGGIVGIGDNGGVVRNCYNTGDIGGGEDVGGVVGWNDVGGTVENCYDIGAVGGSNSSNFVGGVVGCNNNGTVESCFFLQSQVVDEINYWLYGIGYDYSYGNTTDYGAAHVSSDEPASTFLNATGWDFDDVWGIYLNNNDSGNPGYGYPYLKTIGNNVLITPDGGGKDFDNNPAPTPTWTSDISYDASLFSGSLSYDPTPALYADTYNITIGTFDSPYLQLRFQDDVQYVIKGVIPVPPVPPGPQGPGTSYTITASSDSNSTITPPGQVSVQGGSSMTFTYSAASGYHISSVTVNGKDLTQDLITGSYTFTYVLFNSTIVVKSAPGAPITLTISIAQGSGYAEYSLNGSDFVRYVSPVPLNVSDSVTVRADPGDGNSFVKWETPATETSSDVSFQSVTSSLSLKAYFGESGTSPGSSSNGSSSNSNLWMWALAVIIVLIIIGAIIWFVLKVKK